MLHKDTVMDLWRCLSLVLVGHTQGCRLGCTMLIGSQVRQHLHFQVHNCNSSSEKAKKFVCLSLTAWSSLHNQ